MRPLVLLALLGLTGCGTLVPYSLSPGWLAPDVVPEPEFSSVVLLDQQPQADAQAAVRGRVVDLNTGRPVEGAVVTVSGLAADGEATAVAGPDGTFVVAGEARGEVHLRAEAPGYIAAADRVPVEAGAAASVLVTLNRPFALDAPQPTVSEDV